MAGEEGPGSSSICGDGAGTRQHRLGLDGPTLCSHLLLVGSGSRREEPPGLHQQWDKEKDGLESLVGSRSRRPETR